MMNPCLLLLDPRDEVEVIVEDGSKESGDIYLKRFIKFGREECGTCIA